MLKQIGLLLFVLVLWNGVTVHETFAQKKKLKAKPAAKPKDDSVDPPADQTELPLGAQDMLNNEIPRIREQERREAEKRRKAARDGHPADSSAGKKKEDKPTEKKDPGKATSDSEPSPQSVNSAKSEGVVGGVPGGAPTPEEILRKISINRVTPEYPKIARQTNVSGDVVVEILIDKNGRVIDARAVSGPALLRPAAVSAARGWTFHPTLLDGQPVNVTGAITFRFNLVN